MRKTVLQIATLAAVLYLAWTAGAASTRTRDVICDHPDWTESGYAAVAAVCNDGIRVHILD